MSFYRPISRALAIAGNLSRLFGNLHVGPRSTRENEGYTPWLRQSWAYLTYCLTDWALPLRFSLTRTWGTRPGGHPFADGRTMKLTHVMLIVSILCVNIGVTVYLDRQGDA